MERKSMSMRRAFQLAGLAFVLAIGANGFAQSQTASTSTNTRTVSDGQKMKVAGVVTTVALTDRTSIKSKGGFFGGGSSYGQSNILRGLNLEVEGRGNSSGQLVAEKVRFGSTDLRVAQSIQARVDPVESRVGTAE